MVRTKRNPYLFCQATRSILLAALALLAMVTTVSGGELRNMMKNDQEQLILYFAYGSNLDEMQMEQRCPNASIHGRARIKGFRFVINGRGVASISDSPYDVVEGVLWGISASDELVLDWYEGVTGGYYGKKHLLVKDLTTGEMVEALVYIATDVEFGEPRPGYLEKIIKSAQNHGFEEDYLEELKAWKKP